MGRTRAFKASGRNELSCIGFTGTIAYYVGSIEETAEYGGTGIDNCRCSSAQTVGLQSYSVIEEKEFEQLCDELWGKATTTVVDRSVGFSGRPL